MSAEERACVRGPATTPAQRRERLAEEEKKLGGAYWKGDAWDLKTCPLPSADPFRNVPLSNRYIRFGAIRSANMRAEVKCVLYRALQSGRTNPRTMWIRRGSDLASIAHFLDAGYAGAQSLAEIDVEQAVTAYAAALEERHVKSTSTNRKIGGDGVRHPVQVASYHLTILRELLEGARDLYAASDPWESDAWNVRDLPVVRREDKLNPVGSVSEVIDFRRIRQPGCLAAAKSYFRDRLTFRWSVAQTQTALHMMRRFFAYLEREHGGTDAFGVTQAMVDGWLEEVSVMKVGQTTRNRHCHAIEAFLKYCDKKPGLFAQGLSVDSDRYGHAEHGQRGLMPPAKQLELGRLVVALQEPYRQMMEIMALCGWRVSEVLGLTRSCLREGNEGLVEMHCIASKTHREAILALVGPTEDLKGLIASCIDRSQKLYGDRTPFLFPARDLARPCRAETLYRALDETAARLGLTYHFRCHELRHLRLTQFYRMGLSAVDIALMVGHNSSQMTQTYIHPDADTVSRHMQEITERNIREVMSPAQGSEAGTGGPCSLPGDEAPARESMAVGSCGMESSEPCCQRQSFCILSCKSWVVGTGDAADAEAYRERLGAFVSARGASEESSAKVSSVLEKLEGLMKEAAEENR